MPTFLPISPCMLCAVLFAASTLSPAATASAQTAPTAEAREPAPQQIVFDTPRVLIVGDSWSFYMFLDGTINRMFERNGHGEFSAIGARTARSGSKARHWTRPEYLERIDQELAMWPSIDMVQVTLSGNDFLAGKSAGGWYAGMSQEAEEDLTATVLGDLEIVLDHIQSIDPSIEIVVSLYDYPNFVETLVDLGAVFCVDLWNGLNKPTPEELNLAAGRLYASVERRVRDRPKTAFVRHSGTLQFQYGYPSLEIPKHTLVPPGDVRLPSPPEAMRYGGRDCFHLSRDSYDRLADNLWREFYSPRISGVLTRQGFEQGVVWPLKRTDPP